MRAIAFFVGLLAIVALILTGCTGEADLSYDPSPDKLVVQVSTSGGLPTPWVDNVPSFRLWGDGRVVKVPADSKQVALVEGKLEEKAVEDLLKQIEEAGFFDLKNMYRDDRVMDGVTTTVAVNLDSQKKAVSNYMADVPAFAKTVETINNFPVGETHDYVPETGYLVVRKESEPPKNPQVPPPDVAAMLPSGDELVASVANHKPIEIGGKEFVVLKNWEVTQEYAGIDVQVGDTWYKVYPRYEPSPYQ